MLGPRAHADRVEMSLSLVRIGVAVLIFIHGAFRAAHWDPYVTGFGEGLTGSLIIPQPQPGLGAGSRIGDECNRVRLQPLGGSVIVCPSPMVRRFAPVAGALG